MNTLKRYTIPWKGLGQGSHHFEFEVDDAFFKEFEGSGISAGRAEVNVGLERSANMLELQVSIEGDVEVECDRCLDPVDMPVDFEGELKVRFSEETDEYDGEIMWISPAQAELNLAQYIYESIVLSLPYSRVHGDDAQGRSLCNPQMLEKFRIISAEELESMESKAETLAESSESGKLLELKEKLEKNK